MTRYDGPFISFLFVEDTCRSSVLRVTPFLFFFVSCISFFWDISQSKYYLSIYVVPRVEPVH